MPFKYTQCNTFSNFKSFLKDKIQYTWKRDVEIRVHILIINTHISYSTENGETTQLTLGMLAKIIFFVFFW